jgi:hypothetical protein
MSLRAYSRPPTPIQVCQPGWLRSIVPVYLQLAAILRAAIESGRLEPDRPLPSYMTLMQEHGVARGTATPTQVTGHLRSSREPLPGAG